MVYCAPLFCAMIDIYTRRQGSNKMEKQIARVETFTTTRSGNLKSIYTMFDTVNEAVEHKLTLKEASYVQVLSVSVMLVLLLL